MLSRTRILFQPSVRRSQHHVFGMNSEKQQGRSFRYSMPPPPPPTSTSSSSSSSVLMFSTFRPTTPRHMAKVELLSLGRDDIKTGVLTQMVPVGNVVQVGDVIAMIRTTTHVDEEENDKDSPSPNDDNYHNDSRQVVEQVAVYAPQTGRIINTFVNVHDDVTVGDYILELGDEAVRDVKSFQQHVQSNRGRLDRDFMTTYLNNLQEGHDTYRLQHLVQHVPPELQSQALPLYERLLEWQHDDPKEQAKTRTQLGVTFYNLGDIDGCIQELQTALTLRQRSLGENDPQTAATHIHIGSVFRQIGAFKESLDHMKAALNIQKQFLGDEHPIVASSLNNVGALHYQLMDFPNAIQHYSKALAIHQSVHGESNAGTAGTCHNLGVAWKHMGDDNTALEYLQKALAIRQQLLTEISERNNNDDDDNDQTNRNASSADVAASHTALGQLYSEQGNTEAAMEQYDAALTILEGVFGPDSPNVAVGYINKGAVHYQQNDFNEALKLYQIALDSLKKSQPTHPDTASSFNNVGMTFLKLGHLDKALEHHIEARRIMASLFGNDHPNLATTIGSIGNVYKAQGRLQEAMKEFESAHTMLESAVGKDHPDVASSFNNMGLVLSQMSGREDDALQMYRDACASFQKSVGSEHPHVGSCLYNSGLMLQTLGRYDEAIQDFTKACDVWEISLGANHPHTGTAQRSIDECKQLLSTQ